MKLYLLISLFPLFFLSCEMNLSPKEKQQKLTELNDKADRLSMYGDEDDADKIIVVCDEILDLNVNDKTALLRKYMTLVEMDEFDDAFQVGLSINKLSNSPVSQLALGAVSELEGDKDVAKRCYRNADSLYILVLEKSPDDELILLEQHAINLRLMGKDSLADELFDYVVYALEDPSLEKTTEYYKKAKREDILKLSARMMNY